MELVDNLTLEEIDQRIARTAVEAVIEIGYYLKQIRDRELYKQAGYRDVYEYAENQYGYDRSTTSRNMSRNSRFSVGGNSPELAEQYRCYGKSQLQEMISMTDEQLLQVKPDMTIREMRKLMKKPKKEKKSESEPVATSQQQEKSSCPPDVHECSRQEWGTSEKEQEQGRKECAKCWEHWKQLHKKAIPEREEKGEFPQETASEGQLSAYGLPLKEYPPDSLIAMPGCGQYGGGIGYSCFNCHMSLCRIRGVDCSCVEAPGGNPFPCKTLLMLEQEDIRKRLGNRCQFINHDLANHAAGNGSAVPCCKECAEVCDYRCSQSLKSGEEEPQEEPEDNIIDGECREVEDPQEPDLYEETSGKTDGELAQEESEKAGRILDLMREEFSENDIRVRKQKVLIAALAGYIEDLEKQEIPDLEQPELPVFRNNDQRREWLRNYKDWGLWYEDVNIGAKYYKYDFDNGARLIAEVYQYPESGIVPAHESCYLHLVGGPEPPKKAGWNFGKWTRHESYNKHPSNETELVEFLKEVQRSGQK